MKRFNLIKNEDGAVMPLVALVLSIVLLGFAALVIDLGILYAERRTMVTAADAAALAGAMEMEEALGNSDYGKNARDEAEKVARRIAIANGVKSLDDNPDNIQVIWNNPDYGRETITVKVHNNKDLTFAKFLGFDNTDVGAKSVATWGYVRELLGGDLLPIFASQSDYKTSGNVYLHGDKLEDDTGKIISGNWGLLNIPEVKVMDAFMGKKIGETLQIGINMTGETGKAGGHVKGIETRMKDADKLDEKEDRIKYMSGLVPIIDWDKADVHGSTVTAPIEYFAVFEILDYIPPNGNNKNQRSKGSEFALDYETDYKKRKKRKQYESYLADYTIIGRFTGETIDITAVIKPDDQKDPNPDGPSPKYHKLIE